MYHKYKAFWVPRGKRLNHSNKCNRERIRRIKEAGPQRNCPARRIPKLSRWRRFLPWAKDTQLNSDLPAKRKDFRRFPLKSESWFLSFQYNLMSVPPG